MSLFAQQMRKQLGGANAGLESGKLPVSVEGDVSQHLVDVDYVPVIADDTAAAILEEARNDASNLANEIVAIEEVHDADSTLEMISDNVDNAIAEGEMSSMTLDTAAVAIESVMRTMRMGNPYRVDNAWQLMMGDKANLVYSQENARSRLTIGLEFTSNVKEALKAFWTWVKEQVAKVYAYFKKWWNKTLDGFARMRKRAQSIGKRAEDTTGSAKEKDFESSLLVHLHINKKCPTDPISVLKMYQEKAKGLDNSSSEIEKGLTEISEIDLEDHDTVVGKVKEAAENISKSELFVAAKKAGGNTSNDTRFSNYFAVGKDEGYFGGTMFVAAMSVKGATAAKAGINTNPKNGKVTGVKDGADGADLPKFTKMMMGFYPIKNDSTNNPDGAGKMTTLDLGDIKDACEIIVDICDNVIRYKQAWEKRNKFETKMNEALKKAEKVADKAEAADKHKALLAKNWAKASVNLLSSITSSESNTIQHMGSKLNFMLDWCVASLNQYSTNS